MFLYVIIVFPISLSNEQPIVEYDCIQNNYSDYRDGYDMKNTLEHLVTY